MKYPICDQLKGLKAEGRIPFHMPGHKRKELSCFSDITSMDITEITGYDNLHHPEGMIAESMERLKEIYHSKKSWYLVNGSTVGILASISSVCQPGDKIMIARNCHKAVYNAIRLLHLKPIYIYPSYSKEYDMMQGVGEKERKEIAEILKREGDMAASVKAVLITSPTYEGVVSDIRALKDILEPYQIPLIVDEAHGAHFTYHDYFPKSAVECGADLVIQSAHKTLPSFTQTALLHLCSDLIAPEIVEEMLSIYETSSPSYLLMASAEYGVFYTQEHSEQVRRYVDNLVHFRGKCAQLKHIALLQPEDVAGFDYDRGKLVFLVKNTAMDGKELFSRMLEEYHIEFEMETAFYCIAMTSVMDEGSDFEALERAVFSLDAQLDAQMNAKLDAQVGAQFKREANIQKMNSLDTNDPGSQNKHLPDLFSARPVLTHYVWECLNLEKDLISLEEAHGRIAAQYVYLYPPGIPILVPGEKIEKEMVENITYYLYNGYNVPAIEEDRIWVLKEK